MKLEHKKSSRCLVNDTWDSQIALVAQNSEHVRLRKLLFYSKKLFITWNQMSENDFSRLQMKLKGTNVIFEEANNFTTDNECIRASRLCVWCLIYSFICLSLIDLFSFCFRNAFQVELQREEIWVYEFTLQSKQFFFI